MPYLRLHSPEMTREKKRDVARALTDAVQKALHLPPQLRHETLVHFMPYDPENIAVGGDLIADKPEESVCRLLVVGILTAERRIALNRELTPLLACLFGILPEQARRIQIHFHRVEPHDYSVGGRFYEDIHK